MLPKSQGAFCSEFSTTESVPADQAGHNHRGLPGPGAGVAAAAVVAAGSLSAGKWPEQAECNSGQRG